eukprot:403346110
MLPISSNLSIQESNQNQSSYLQHKNQQLTNRQSEEATGSPSPIFNRSLINESSIQSKHEALMLNRQISSSLVNRKKFSNLEVYAKIKRTFNLPNHLLLIDIKEERDQKIQEFMDKKMKEDLNQLEQTQKDHLKNQEKFNLKLSKSMEKFNTKSSKTGKQEDNWIKLETTHKALEKRLKQYLIEDRLNDFRTGNNTTVSNDQLELLSSGKDKKKKIMREYEIELKIKERELKLQDQMEQQLKEQQEINPIIDDGDEDTKQKIKERMINDVNFRDRQIKKDYDNMIKERKQQMIEKLKERKQWNKTQRQELMNSTTTQKQSKSLMMRNNTTLNFNGTKDNGDRIDWNPEFEAFFRKYRKEVRRRLTNEPGSRKDRFDDVTSLAFRKLYKGWDKLDSEVKFEKEIQQSKMDQQRSKTSDGGWKNYKYEKVKQIIMKSQFLKKHIDKEEFQKKLKQMDKNELEQVEYEIAEKIISRYQGVQNQLKTDRQVYLQSLNEAYQINEQLQVLENTKPKQQICLSKTQLNEEKPIKERYKTIKKLNNYLKFYNENPIIDKEKYKQLLIKSKSSEDLRKRALQNYNEQQQQSTLAQNRSRNMIDGNQDTTTTQDSQVQTNVVGVVQQQNIEEQMNFSSNMANGISMYNGMQQLNYVNFFGPKIARPLTQSRLITGGPPKMINSSNLEKFIRWLDKQNLKVNLFPLINILISQKIIRAAIRIQAAFRTFVIKKKYYFAINHGKDDIQITKQKVLIELEEKQAKKQFFINYKHFYRMLQAKQLEKDERKQKQIDYMKRSKLRLIKSQDFSGKTRIQPQFKITSKTINAFDSPSKPNKDLQNQTFERQTTLKSTKTQKEQKVQKILTLFYAVYNQDLGMLKHFLTEKRFDVQTQEEKSGQTILHAAMKLNSKQMALLILQDGCKNDPIIQKQLMCIRDNKGLLAFDYLENYKNLDILLKLEVKGICVHQVNFTQKQNSYFDYQSTSIPNQITLHQNIDHNSPPKQITNQKCKIVTKVKCLKDVEPQISTFRSDKNSLGNGQSQNITLNQKDAIFNKRGSIRSDFIKISDLVSNNEY